MSNEGEQAASKLQPGRLASPELLDAIAACCFLMASADGEVSDEEVERIAETLQELTDSDEAIKSVHRHLLTMALEMKNKGVDDYLREITSRVVEPEQRRAALEYAARVAFVDGKFDFEEEVLLEQLASAFELSRSDVDAVVARVQQGA